MRNRLRLLPILSGAVLVLVPLLASCRAAHVRYHLQEADTLYRAQKYEEAVEKYREALEVSPKSWEANYRIAMSYLAIYHPGSQHPKDVEAARQAKAALETCMALHAPDESTALKLRNYYLALLVAQDQIDEAIAFSERLLQDQPANVDVVAQLATLYAKKGDFPNALKYFERRAELDPGNKNAWYTVGVVCWERSYRGGAMVSQQERQEVIAKGMAALDRALAIDPKSFEALSYVNLLYRERAKVLRETGDQNGAISATATADEFFKKALAAKKTPIASAK
jgi:tetratricopeptide (TPR) repeat protein